MFQGTGSGVGKSIVAAAFCRLLKRRGYSVAPFKAQNMALNSFVTADGREMGRAQVFQAEACGLEPDARMNPVLLKPTGDSKSQVILMGRPHEHLSAADYYERSRVHWEVVKKAYKGLSRDFDVLVIEGAGSPAEINLQKTDIVNMKMAEYACASVIIVADIDKGGVFASLKGTFDLIQDEHRSLVKGFLINKFRGDVRLLEPGIDMFAKINPVPILGVLPWFTHIHVDEEDGVFVENITSCRTSVQDLHVSIIKLPRISNFTDFSPLSHEPGVRLKLATMPEEAEGSHLVIIPGTKTTIPDLRFLKDKGWDIALERFQQQGTFIMGICGGYQMLGRYIDDEHGSDGSPDSSAGLGLLPVHTRMKRQKTLRQVKLDVSNPALSHEPMPVEGYEIHMGTTRCLEHAADMAFGIGLGPETGVFDPDKRVLGTYLHGIFENDEFRTRLLNFIRRSWGLPEQKEVFNYRDFRKRQFDQLADWLENSARVERLIELIDD